MSYSRTTCHEYFINGKPAEQATKEELLEAFVEAVDDVAMFQEIVNDYDQEDDDEDEECDCELCEQEKEMEERIAAIHESLANVFSKLP